MIRVCIEEAIANLRSAKLRSFLAILGILVGTASVVAMVSCGKIVTKEALAQFQQLGTDLMSVSLNAKDDEQRKVLKEFNIQQIASLRRTVPAITNIAPYTSTFVDVNFNGTPLNATIIGATESLAQVVKIGIESGRFVSILDKYQPYCVIGHDVHKKILSLQSESPVGHQIQLGREVFTIIGVAEAWQENSFFYQDINNSIIIPIQASQLLSKYTLIDNMIVNLQQNSDIKEVETQIQKTLNTEIPQIAVYFRSASQLIDSMKKQSQLFTILLGLIGSISLIVGGIGVMNVMLVSVVERRREIGIRKALGARRRDIRVMFLVESVMLSMFGGILGVIIGILTSYSIAHFAGWAFSLFLLPPVIGFIVSVASGIFFGSYPAYAAAKLDPIETLRAE